MTKVKSKVTHHSSIVGSNLREIRSRQGWSQASVAEILDVSCQQIQKYESGKNRIPLEHIHKLKTSLGLQYEDFFLGLDECVHAEPGQYILQEMSLSICKEVEKIKSYKTLKIVQDIVSIFSNAEVRN